VRCRRRRSAPGRRRLCGRDEQRGLRRLGQRFDPARVRCLERLRRGQRLRQRLVAGALALGERSRQFDQRERVARRSPVQLGDD